MNILLFGATGSAGGSVLDVCLASPAVTTVRVLARRASRLSDRKLQWVEHRDFTDYAGREGLFSELDACLFCLGKSVTQVSGEDEYRRITRDFAIAAAAMLQQHSPGAIFHYVSGAGASLASRFMWARVKAEAERDLVERAAAVCWRPGAIDGTPSDSEPTLYRLMRPAYGLLRPLRSLYVSGTDIGLAMLHATRAQLRSRIIENAELRDMADQERKREAPVDQHART